MKTTLILIDRDGTLIYDNKYYLGSQNNWREKIKILPKVIEGLKKLRKIPPVKIYMITNQPGVAIKNFPELTLSKANEVCRYVLKQLENKGVKLDGYFLCPHASQEYTKNKPGKKFHSKLVCNCSCIKPDLGMVTDALQKENLSLVDTSVYVVGDRATDVQTAIHVGGTGIFIPFANETGEINKVNKINSPNIYTADDFLDGMRYIIKKES